MQIDVTFRGTESSDALQQRAEKKMAKVAKHLREPIEAHIVFRVEKHRHTVEVTVHAAGEHHSASDTTDDMYTSIDGVFAKMERSARRHRDRVIDRSHHGAGGHEDADGFIAPVEPEA
jgi:putative sigma-54 modulation protein